MITVYVKAHISTRRLGIGTLQYYCFSVKVRDVNRPKQSNWLTVGSSELPSTDEREDLARLTSILNAIASSMDVSNVVHHCHCRGANSKSEVFVKRVDDLLHAFETSCKTEIEARESNQVDNIKES